MKVGSTEMETTLAIKLSDTTQQTGLVVTLMEGADAKESESISFWSEHGDG